MKSTLKVWTGLGLATALTGAGLAGCTEEAASTSETDKAVHASEGGEAGEGEESGEGGVEVATAGSDPVVYGIALAIVEAHVIAARDAYLKGKTDSAGEMFAHPVSEVLLDMDPIFAERRVDDFKPLLLEASSGALNGESAEQMNERYEAIILALRGAAEKAPDNDTSKASIAGRIAADMVERAISMYGEAAQSDRYEPFLDGYGFYKTAQGGFTASAAAIEAENADLHANLVKALELLRAAYPSAERPESLDVNQGQLSAAGSRVQLSL